MVFRKREKFQCWVHKIIISLKKIYDLLLDFEEDLDQLNKIYSNFRNKDHVTLEEAIKYLNKNPKIININKHLIAKFKKTEKNTELNI